MKTVAAATVMTLTLLTGGRSNARNPDVAATPSSGRLLVGGLRGTIGGAIGPDGALYVPEAAAARCSTRSRPAGRPTRRG